MTQVDFKLHLCRQLGFIELSCTSFDYGFHDEAIRIATVIRVLIHQTSKSTSLLTHLGATNVGILSTCIDIVAKFKDPNSLAYGATPRMFNGMGAFSLGQNATYAPKLGNSYVQSFLTAHDWWNQVVFILDKNTWVTRKQVALAAANKDGGAHIDTKLTPNYGRLIESGDLGYLISTLENQEIVLPITGHHYVALRQMGYEILNSPDLIALSR